MKKRLLKIASLIFLLAPLALSAQLKPMGQQQQGVTRAVVVGVSEYQNERIPKLLFAHADADAFARYLRSPAGGALPESNIKVLTDKEATQGRMAAALTWLLEESVEGDQAIIYFSGHGDMETQTMMNHGFLLTYDAPASTYMAGGAFPVFYLQSIVQTLSAQKKVQVTLIADACHAGKLAGSTTGGAQATARGMAEQFANETKMLSCQPNEFSIEGRQWGGGHGVFTYHLIDGLTGLADANGDMIVSLLELQRFLEDRVSADAAPHSQIPLVFGNKSITAARVDAPSLAALKTERAKPRPGDWDAAVASRSVPKTAEEDSVSLAIYRRFQASLARKHLLYPEEDAAYHLYIKLRDRPAMAEYRQEMRRNLAAALQDESQQAINDYLAASPLELRRRWSFDTRYEHYPEYLGKAAEVLGTDHFMYTELNAKERYFSGLNLRLKGEQTRDAALYRQAEALQLEVLKRDPNAAYAHNELGLLARRRGDFAGSILHFQQALALSPTWVLAETNLCGSYIDLDRPQDAVEACSRALQHDPTFALAHHNLGVALLEQQKGKEAIAAFRKALQYDPQYAMTFVKLGEAFYFQEKDPEQAIAVWKDALLLTPTDANTLYNLGLVSAEVGRTDEALGYYKSVIALHPDDTDARLEVAELHTAAGRYADAEAELQTCLQLDANLAAAYYLQARLYALQNRTDAALDALETALEKGFNDRKRLQSDAQLNSIRRQARYKAAVKKYWPK
jgi:protein O-mannosyl-transferase